MRRLIAIATSLTVLTAGLGGCQPADPSKKLARQYRLTDEQCVLRGGWFSNAPSTPQLWNHVLSAKPGAQIELSPTLRNGPGLSSGEAGCLRDITSDPKGLTATWTSDGKLVLTVPQDAPSGQIYTIAATYGGKNVRAEVAVYRPDSQPLVGGWHQKVGCGGREPMRELIFAADGSFRATYTPFESYYDFWGSYRFDTETSTLTLDITGGNKVPDTARDGTIEIEGDSFRLGTANLGGGDGSVCTAPFTRRKARG